jgi:hypothetical protein
MAQSQSNMLVLTVQIAPGEKSVPMLLSEPGGLRVTEAEVGLSDTLSRALIGPNRPGALSRFWAAQQEHRRVNMSEAANGRGLLLQVADEIVFVPWSQIVYVRQKLAPAVGSAEELGVRLPHS